MEVKGDSNASDLSLVCNDQAKHYIQQCFLHPIFVVRMLACPLEQGLGVLYATRDGAPVSRNCSDSGKLENDMCWRFFVQVDILGSREIPAVSKALRRLATS